jgi:hypothetical protein
MSKVLYTKTQEGNRRHAAQNARLPSTRQFCAAAPFRRAICDFSPAKSGFTTRNYRADDVCPWRQTPAA